MQQASWKPMGEKEKGSGPDNTGRSRSQLPSPWPHTHILQLFEATLQLLLSPAALLKVLCKQRWLGSPGLR